MRFSAVLFVAALMSLFAYGVHAAYVELFSRPHVANAAELSSAPSTAPVSIQQAQSAIVDAAASVMPAVVSVETKQRITIPGFGHSFKDPFFRQFFGDEFFNQQPRSGVNQGLGSGVIVDSRGYVLTNFHVVQGADEITVRLDNGREFSAKVVGSDERLDIAVIKLDGPGPFSTAPLGNSDDLRVGMFVLAMGTPFNRNLSQTVTMGIVSALSRSGLGIEQEENFIQTDAAINQGNSGGPLVNLKGEVIGINVAIVTGGGAGSAGVGLAIPINSARHSLESLIKSGKVVRGYLGVEIQSIDEDLRQSMNLPSTHGALVTEVVDGSPAARAGIQRGDVILSLNSRSVPSPSALTAAVASMQAGESAALEYLRDGARTTVDVTVAVRPDDRDHVNRIIPGHKDRSDSDEESQIGKLGVTVKFVEGSAAKKLGLPTGGALLITAVEPESPADGKGLRAGMGILEVDRKPVGSVEELEESLKKSGRHVLLIGNQGSNQYISVSL